MTTIRKSTSDFVSVNWEQGIPGSVADDALTYLFPPVYGRTKTGKTTEWLITVRIYDSMEDAQDDADPVLITPEIAHNRDMTAYIARILVFYRLGDGKIQTKIPTFIAEGKNRGRSNETNTFCQALRDCLGLYYKQQRRVGDIESTTASAEASASESTSADAPASAQDPASSTTETDPLEATPEPVIGDIMPLPMLARLYHDVYSEEDSPSPLFVQRKYNGVRAVGTLLHGMEPLIYSRKGLRYEGFPALRDEIARIGEAWDAKTIFSNEQDIGLHVGGTLYLDGELYKHGMSLQVISGIVRRAHGKSKDRALDQDNLSFVVYDVFIVNKGSTAISGLNFDDRFAFIRAIQRSEIGASLRIIQFAETFTCANKVDAASGNVIERAIDQVRPLYTRFLSEGYEGAIVRINAPYAPSENDRHSRVLLKIKPVRDAEYKIVGYTTGARGKAAGALLFICETPVGAHKFNITPTGTIESRIALAREFAVIEENGKTVFDNKWLGQPLIVLFDELSPTGIPQRARTDGTIRTCP